MSTRMYKTTVVLVIVAVLVLGIAWQLQKRPTEPAPTSVAKQTDTPTGPGAYTPAGNKASDGPGAAAKVAGEGLAKPTADQPASGATRTPEYPAVIDLGMGKCIPCKQMKPILEELMQEYKGRARIEIIDIGQRPDQAEKHKVMLIPTQIFFDKDGQEVYRHEGFMPQADIVARLKEMGVE